MCLQIIEYKIFYKWRVYKSYCMRWVSKSLKVNFSDDGRHLAGWQGGTIGQGCHDVFHNQEKSGKVTRFILRNQLKYIYTFYAAFFTLLIWNMDLLFLTLVRNFSYSCKKPQNIDLSLFVFGIHDELEEVTLRWFGKN